MNNLQRLIVRALKLTRPSSITTISACKQWENDMQAIADALVNGDPEGFDIVEYLLEFEYVPVRK